MIHILLDKSLFIQFINFVVLLVLLNAILFKPLRDAIRKRVEKFQADENEIKRLDSEAEDKLRLFQEGLEEARKKGMEQREALKQEAKEEEKKILDEVYKEVEQNLSQVKEQIAKDVEQVRAKLKEQAQAFALEIAEKILGRPVSDEQKG